MSEGFQHLAAMAVGALACAVPVAVIFALFEIVGVGPVLAVATLFGLGVLFYAVGRNVLDMLNPAEPS